MEANRGKAILQRWIESKANDPPTEGNAGKTIPLEMFIDYQYNLYLKACYGCNELPLTKGKWMLQIITLKNENKIL